VTDSVTTVDTSDMLLIHRLIRREIGMLPQLFRGAAGDPVRAKVVAAHATEMLDFLHIHHTGEDQLMWPVLRIRVKADDGLIDRMESQHGQLATAVDEVRAALPGWAESADAETGERMAATLDNAIAVLTEHLAEEEARILPLVSAHLSPTEWKALADHGFAAIPRRRRLVILGHILEEADEDERRRFMKMVPPPARLAYSLVGRRQFARETAAIRG
jgi:hemerythrin-like domain-containing protein